MKKLVLILVFGLAALNTSYAKVPEISLEPRTIADEMPSEDDFDLLEAIKGFQQAIKQDPNNYELYSILSLACDHAGDYVCSLDALKKMLKLLPEDYQEKDIIYGNLGRAYMLNNLWEEGKEWLDKADVINPDNYYNRANVFSYYILYKKDFEAAALELEKIQKLLPEQDVYYDMYQRTKDHELVSAEDLESVYKSAVNIDPDNYRAYRVLGVVYRDSSLDFKGDGNDEILKNFKKALDLNPDYVPTYLSIGGQYMMMATVQKDEKYLDDAFQYLSKARDIDPNDLNAAFMLGTYYFNVEDYESAIKNLEVAFDGGLRDDFVKGHLVVCYNELAYAYYQSGKNLDKGLKLIDKALSMYPYNGIILSTKAELLYKKGDYEQAHEYIQQAIALEPDQEEILQDLVNIEAALTEKKD